jgi:hypothetical protein
MARRIGALIGIVVVLGLAVTLLWRVHLHHQMTRNPDEPALVSLNARRS